MQLKDVPVYTAGQLDGVVSGTGVLAEFVYIFQRKAIDKKYKLN